VVRGDETRVSLVLLGLVLGFLVFIFGLLVFILAIVGLLCQYHSQVGIRNSRDWKDSSLK